MSTFDVVILSLFLLACMHGLFGLKEFLDLLKWQRFDLVAKQAIEAERLEFSAVVEDIIQCLV